MRKMHSGTVYYDPSKAYNGYTLWAQLEQPQSGAEKPGQWPREVFLMDMRGKTVHSWKLDYPAMYGYLQENGNLLVALYPTETDGTRPGYPPYPLGGMQGILREYDWDGNILFEHKDLRMHHDFKKLPNGNYMYLIWERMEPELAKKVRGGIKDAVYPDGTVWSDSIVEVDPQGNEVWKWRSVDHLDIDIDIRGPLHPRVEWTHFNTLWVTEEGDIMSSGRFCDIALKIDRKSGDIVWRWGQVAYLDKETGQIEFRCNKNTLGGQHDVHVIPKGLPGAGHMLCYDNGMYKSVSRAVEVDMETNEVVWESTARSVINGRIDYSCYISGARRLPNGNTILCHGQDGMLNEVTPDHEVVWEWYNPIEGKSHSKWAIFRAFRYGPDFCPQFKNLPPAEGEDIK